MPLLIKSAVIIEKDNTFLLVREKSKRVQGLWNWPQGKNDQGESPEEAAIRETNEETGLSVQLIKKLAVLTDTFPDTKEIHIYGASITRGEIKFPEHEIMDAQFFTLKEIKDMKDELVGPWVYDTIFRFSKEK